MGYEIDFLPVGDKSKGGDAIAIRFGDLNGERDQQFVMVVDGGYKENGEALVAHIKKYYGTEVVDLVLCTHPDNDHIGGLSVVLEELTVKELAIHMPWSNSNEIYDFVMDGRRTEKGIENHLVKSLSQAQDLVDLAESKDIPVWQPFEGQNIPELPDGYEITVLGPSVDYYNLLMSNFIEGSSQKENDGILKQAVEALLKLVEESFDFETLTDPDEDATTPMNNSSAILHLNLNDRVILLTGDAGAHALEKAMDYADENNIGYYQPRLMQVPHHGSKRNVGPTILNRILGPKGQEEERGSVASVPKEGSPKHPAKKVLNAFGRRGCIRNQTCGSTLCYSHDSPDRGWGPADRLPFFDEVEE